MKLKGLCDKLPEELQGWGWCCSLHWTLLKGLCDKLPEESEGWVLFPALNTLWTSSYASSYPTHLFLEHPVTCRCDLGHKHKHDLRWGWGCVPPSLIQVLCLGG